MSDRRKRESLIDLLDRSTPARVVLVLVLVVLSFPLAWLVDWLVS